jgi:hypothetical protein
MSVWSSLKVAALTSVAESLYSNLNMIHATHARTLIGTMAMCMCPRAGMWVEPGSGQ